MDHSFDERATHELADFMRRVVPYWTTLGLQLKQVEKGAVVFEGVVRDDLIQNGLLHGGVFASIADSACAVAGISMVFPENYATTINLHVSYLKPVSQGKFMAKGTCLKKGRNVLFCEAQVFDESGALVATASSELLVISRSQ